MDAGLSVRELSLRAGCSRQCVETALKRHGLAAKGQRGVMPRFIRRRGEEEEGESPLFFGVHRFFCTVGFSHASTPNRSLVFMLGYNFLQFFN